MAKLGVVGHRHAAFHRGDVVREEKAVRAHIAKTSGLASVQLGIERFTVIFEKI